MARHRTGGCLCGAVRYRCEGEPAGVGLCQCDHCQRQSGSAFLVLVIYPKDAVAVYRGRLATCTTTADTGRKVQRQFCADCGAPVLLAPDKYPAICAVTGGTLDQRTDLKPTFSFWCSRQPDWLSLPADLTRYPDYPEASPL